MKIRPVGYDDDMRERLGDDEYEYLRMEEKLDRAGEYRDDDVRDQGFCPHCRKQITVDVDLYGRCDEHGRVPADFGRLQ